MTKKISIIVPVYNAEKTIKRCVESLLNQTYNNIEIILVDDGSKDSSLSICNDFLEQDKRVLVIHKGNGGVSSARNIGLDNATGDYIMFCDSDDWVERNWCERLVMEANEKDLFVCGHFIEGNQEFFPREVYVSSVEEYFPSDFLKLKMRFFTCLWNKIYCRYIIADNGIRFSDLVSNGEDYLFNLEYVQLMGGKIKYIPGCTYHYIWPTRGSLSVNIPDNYLMQVDYLYNRLLEIAQKMHISECSAIYDDYFFCYQNYILSIVSEKVNILEKIKKCNRIMRTEEYQRCASIARISSNRLYAMLWRLKNSIGIVLWNKFF